MTQKNLFENIPQEIPDEIFEVLVSNPGVTIERIVSKGHCSPDNFWYDQERNEWVLLLQGHARVQFFEEATVALQPGDCITIPAHCKHRVAWTDPDEETIWLAVFYPD